MDSQDYLMRKYRSGEKNYDPNKSIHINKSPQFFRDDETVGDILSQAREAVTNSQELQSRLNQLRESLSQAEQSTAEARYEHELRSQLQLGSASEGWTERLKTHWHELQEKLHKETDALRQQLRAHQAEIRELREQLDESASDEADSTSDVAEAVNEVTNEAERMQTQLDEVDQRQEAVESLVASGQAERSVISRHEWRFLTTGYFNVVEGRLNQLALDHPITGEHYPPEAWTIKRDRRESQLEATLGRKWLRQDAFQVKVSIPTPSVEGEGFLYQPIGEELLEWIQNEIQDVSGNAYLVLGVASPIGFTETLETYIRQLYAPNASVYLVDLQEHRLTYNDGDAPTEALAHLMAPQSLDEQLGPIRDGVQDLLSSEPRLILRDTATRLDVPPTLLAKVFREIAQRSEFNLYIEDDEDPQEALLYRV